MNHLVVPCSVLFLLTGETLKLSDKKKSNSEPWNLILRFAVSILPCCSSARRQPRKSVTNFKQTLAKFMLLIPLKQLTCGHSLIELGARREAIGHRIHCHSVSNVREVKWHCSSLVLWSFAQNNGMLFVWRGKGTEKNQPGNWKAVKERQEQCEKGAQTAAAWLWRVGKVNFHQADEDYSRFWLLWRGQERVL